MEMSGASRADEDGQRSLSAALEEIEQTKNAWHKVRKACAAQH